MGMGMVIIPSWRWWGWGLPLSQADNDGDGTDIWTCFKSILPLLLGITDNLLVSLALIYVMQLTGLLQYCVRLSVEVESSMTAVERLASYSKVTPEAAYTIEPSSTTSSSPSLSNSSWPTEGRIRIENYRLRYRPELPLVLKGIDAEVMPREKVGICGRTGILITIIHIDTITIDTITITITKTVFRRWEIKFCVGITSDDWTRAL